MNTLKKETLVLAFALFAFTASYAQRGGDNGDRPSGPPSVKNIFKKLDTNEDEKISLKEAKGPLKKDFSKIDTDEDGFITKEELEKAPKPERKERRERE